MYPAVREHVPGGHTPDDKEIQEHAEMERDLEKRENAEVGSPRFDHLTRKPIADVTEHVREEEQRLFPALAQACTPDGLFALGEKVRRAEHVAPARPHPRAPDTAPADRILDPGLGLVDRVRDFVTGRGRS
ncbi:hemerythrin domain-containing protein [Streptomyces sp. NPDC088354]|uniref:hemerythrin domain-containing protein n=1 Tax=unclassified Streptomyces TaxID=2593676 RepID=UPI0029BD89CE|nr:hemerythrin domain-containing protein [Streptomyces sp. MI02-7b]MDX3070990.1 hemerythrin domain-containing protein [Streptomyces sp. MI02-7b]